MTKEQMKARTKQFALRIINLVSSLPRTVATDAIGRQLVRSGTSVGANYRASCRARSSADFISKMTIVEEEADETVFWLELLTESGTVAKERLLPLMREADELLRITVASINTARGHRRNSGN